MIKQMKELADYMAHDDKILGIVMLIVLGICFSCATMCMYILIRDTAIFIFGIR